MNRGRSIQLTDALAKTAYVVLNQGSGIDLTRLLGRLRVNGGKNLTIASITSHSCPTLPQVFGDAAVIPCHHLSPAAAWNRAIESVGAEYIVCISDKVFPDQQSIERLLTQLIMRPSWVMGRPRRSLANRRSPLLSFLAAHKLEYPLDEVQDENNVSGDFFHLDFTAFRRLDFAELGGVNENFGQCLFHADMGRRIYSRGGTISLVKEALATIQYEPWLEDCCREWQHFGKELLPFWELYPDSQICIHGSDTISRWASRQVDSEAKRQLEILDKNLRRTSTPRPELAEKLQPVYASIAAQTVSRAVLGDGHRLRSLLLGHGFSQVQTPRSKHVSVSSLPL